MWHAESQLPDQGSNLHPLHWKCGVLTTGPPGKTQIRFEFKICECFRKGILYILKVLSLRKGILYTLYIKHFHINIILVQYNFQIIKNNLNIDITSCSYIITYFRRSSSASYLLLTLLSNYYCLSLKLYYQIIIVLV